MSFTQYSAGREILLLISDNLVVTNDGTLGVDTVMYISIQGVNRVGSNLNSTLVPVTLTPTSRLTITLPALLDSEDWLSIVISASTTNDVETLTQIINVDINDVTTPVVLTSSEIFKLTNSERTVTNVAALPASPIHGLIRYVTTLNYYYEYDQHSTKTVDGLNVLSAVTGRWIRVGTINTYIANTQNAGGCDQDVRTPNLTVVTPSYAVDGSKGEGVVFWIRNDYSSIIPAGTRVSCTVRLFEEDKSQLFDSLLILESLGYVNLTTGALDVAGATGEIEYKPRSQWLTLPEDLPIGSAIAVRVSPIFRPEHLDGQVPYLGNLTTYLTFAPTSGIYAPGVFGNIIYPLAGRWRILPDAGLSVRKNSGSGIILKFELNDLPSELITVNTNAATQNIFLTSNGNTFSSTDASFVGTVKRATVGTVNGESVAFSYGTVGDLPFNLTVNYTNLIRADYPDIIAGNVATNNATNLVIYLKDSSNNYLMYEDTIAPNASSDVFALTLADFTSVAGLPITLNNFGLFKPSSTSVSVSGTTYELYISFKYVNVVTVIDHSVSELVEANVDIQTIFSGEFSKWFTGNGVPDVSLGKNNDYYLNTLNSDVYFKTTFNAWELVANIKGENGIPGVSGIDGIDGATGSVSSASSLILSAIIQPTTNIGEYALYVLDTDNKLHYREPSDGVDNTIAVLNKSQQYVGTQGVEIEDLIISGGVVTANLENSNKFNLSVTENITNFTVTNLKSATYIFNLTEDGVGGHTVTLDPALFFFPDGDTTTINTTANKRNKIVCDCDGVRLDCTLTVYS